MSYLWVIFGISVLYYFYKNVYKPTKYWKEKNIPYLAAVPLLGSMASNIFTRKLARPELIAKMYKSFPNAKYIGLHQYGTRVLMIRDPEIIKEVTIKQYNNFLNRFQFITEEAEPLFGKSLFLLSGQRWKDMRSTVSPAFTASKMRTMFPLIQECAEQVVKYFDKQIEQLGMVQIEMKDTFTRYANDVVATTIFGIQCDSFKNRDNEFYTFGKMSSKLDGIVGLKVLLCLTFPRLFKLLNIKILNAKLANYFKNLITSTIRLREEKNIIRPDMIHLLVEVRKGNLKHDVIEEESSFSAVNESNLINTKNEFDNKTIDLNDEDITALAFSFFFAGFDSNTSTISFMTYELALNPDIQKKLQDEIDETFAHKKFDYETILKMKYLDMVVSETLRKWPVSIISDRVCNNSCTINISGEGPLLVEKGTLIWIPTIGVHNDPKYYSNPEKFDPERFNNENKDNIQPFTYLPFGSGPRNCIGSRYSLLKMKIIIVYFLSKFEFVVTENTDIPLILDKTVFNFGTEKGIWLGLKRRS